jgi:RNA polymerase sigma-70 factor (ECF subfamily)
MKNEADAEDVVQEAVLKAYRALASFRSESKFGTWLISITLNEARNRLRRTAVTPTVSLDVPEDEPGAVAPALLRDWREIPSSELERSEVRHMLQSAVESLPEIYKCVFVLRDVEELSVQETSAALNISVPSVKVRLHRARMMLQKQLAPQLKSVGAAPKRRWFPW